MQHILIRFVAFASVGAVFRAGISGNRAEAKAENSGGQQRGMARRESSGRTRRDVAAVILGEGSDGYCDINPRGQGEMVRRMLLTRRCDAC